MTLQIEDGRSRWLGLTDDDWASLFDAYGWRQRLTNTLLEIIWSRDTPIDERTSALEMLSQGVKANLLPLRADMPDTVCQVLILSAQGDFKVPWYRRFGLARRRREISSQLLGARALLVTAAQFYAPQQTVQQVLPASSPAEALVS